VQIKEKGIEQSTGESVGILAISEELWTVFWSSLWHCVAKKVAASFHFVTSVAYQGMCTTLLMVALLIPLAGRVQAGSPRQHLQSGSWRYIYWQLGRALKEEEVRIQNPLFYDFSRSFGFLA